MRLVLSQNNIHPFKRDTTLWRNLVSRVQREMSRWSGRVDHSVRHDFVIDTCILRLGCGIFHVTRMFWFSWVFPSIRFFSPYRRAPAQRKQSTSSGIPSLAKFLPYRVYCATDGVSGRALVLSSKSIRFHLNNFPSEEEKVTSGSYSGWSKVWSLHWEMTIINGILNVHHRNSRWGWPKMIQLIII